jgi:hypothetical protein
MGEHMDRLIALTQVEGYTTKDGKRVRSYSRDGVSGPVKGPFRLKQRNVPSRFAHGGPSKTPVPPPPGTAEGALKNSSAKQDKSADSHEALVAAEKAATLSYKREEGRLQKPKNLRAGDQIVYLGESYVLDSVSVKDGKYTVIAGGKNLNMGVQSQAYLHRAAHKK